MALETRDILFIGPDTKLYERFGRDLVDALKIPDDCDVNIDVLESFRDVPFYFTQKSVPRLIFIDRLNPELGSIDSEFVMSFLESKSSIIPDSSVFMIVNENPSAAQTQRLLKAGLSGFFSREMHVKGFEEVIEETLKLQILKHPRVLRIEEKQSVEIHLASFEQAVVAETVNVGIGGIFIRGIPQNLKIGDAFKFKLNFTKALSLSGEGTNPIDELNKNSSSEQSPIEGQAMVVWIRRSESHEGPVGFGAQFLKLNTDGRRMIENYLAHKSAAAFIPKG